MELARRVGAKAFSKVFDLLSEDSLQTLAWLELDTKGDVGQGRGEGCWIRISTSPRGEGIHERCARLGESPCGYLERKMYVRGSGLRNMP